MMMSNKQILDYFETDKIMFDERGVKGKSCVQTAGTKKQKNEKIKS